MIKKCADKAYADRLERVGLTTLECWRTRADFIEVCKILKGFKELRNNYSLGDTSNTRVHSMKLYKDRVNRDVLKYSFANRIFEQLNRLPEEVVIANSINSFKNKVDKYLRVLERVKWVKLKPYFALAMNISFSSSNRYSRFKIVTLLCEFFKPLCTLPFTSVKVSSSYLYNFKYLLSLYVGLCPINLQLFFRFVVRYYYTS